MKVLAVILSIYFLGLNVVPCSDTAPTQDDTQTEVVSTQDIDHEHQDSDDCTPFCQCHCCHVHTLDIRTAAFEPIDLAISDHIFLHFDSLGEDIPHTLLQPPRG